MAYGSQAPPPGMSPFMARRHVVASPPSAAHPAQPGGQPPSPPPVQDLLAQRRLILEKLFAGAPEQVGAMLAQWVLLHRPHLAVEALVPRTVAIGERLNGVAQGAANPLTLIVPTQTVFYGMAITTRDTATREVLRTNTDVLMSLTTNRSVTLIGSSDHQCPVAPFDPAGQGHTRIAPFMAGQNEKLAIAFQNQGPEPVTITINLMGLGLYTGNGQTL
jgi:hypothetical protein